MFLPESILWQTEKAPELGMVTDQANLFDGLQPTNNDHLFANPT
jgi:hypothetical protein